MAYRPLVLALLAAQYVASLQFQNDAATCGPAVITTSHITTITVEQLITFSHTCYTKTVATPASGGDCPDLAACAPHPMCIKTETTTAFVPPADPCCLKTPTKTIDGPCETCATGCATSTSTVFVTTTAPTPAPVKRDAASTVCNTTVWRSSHWASGPTTTYHPLTQTIITMVHCNGCSLVISDLDGVGPVISPTATVTDNTPLTVTTYACQD
ncbi:hypothetical protein LSUE1_G002505 [Lachnellula suecica]|uniref:Uncharacterized protein n=1 Tax=Lachnellula suecica TaxID=602035 RepID=A0A8T9C6P8_9HELO|nr:hypothetical protein LSUE1_G002505 [Lachnellula suecica]